MGPSTLQMVRFSTSIGPETFDSLIITKPIQYSHMCVEELKCVISELERHNIKYWVDSGSLLGLIRDSHLLKSDPDIDITVWYSEIGKIDEYIKMAESKGYRAKRKYFEGTLYGYSLKPTNITDRTRKVDIKVLTEYLDYGYTPARRLAIGNTRAQGDLRYYIKRMIRSPALFYNKYSRSMDMGKIPWRLYYKFKTYVVPKEFIDKLKIHEKFECRIPVKTGSYLSYRYGNWMEPVSNWDWWEDDGAIVDFHPHELTGMSEDTIRNEINN